MHRREVLVDVEIKACDDEGTKKALHHLLTREITHANMFMKALDEMGKLDDPFFGNVPPDKTVKLVVVTHVHQDPAAGLRMTVSAGANVGERLMAVGWRHYGRIRRTAGDWLGRAQCLVLQGFVEQAGGSPVFARDLLRTARADFDAIGYRLGLAQCDVALAHTEHREGRFTKEEGVFPPHQRHRPELSHDGNRTARHRHRCPLKLAIRGVTPDAEVGCVDACCDADPREGRDHRDPRRQPHHRARTVLRHRRADRLRQVDHARAGLRAGAPQ